MVLDRHGDQPFGIANRGPIRVGLPSRQGVAEGLLNRWRLVRRSAAQLGQLLLDIQALQKELPLTDAPFKSQALNVLTADQKAKLPKLSEALQLQSAAGQAGVLLLIDYPQYAGPPRILPALDVAGVVSK